MSETFKLTVDEHGAVHLPPEVRRRFGLENGAEIVAEVDAEGLRLHTPCSDRSGVVSFARWRDISHDLIATAEA